MQWNRYLKAAYGFLVLSTNWDFEVEDALSTFHVETWDSVTVLVQYFSFVLLKIQVDFLIG